MKLEFTVFGNLVKTFESTMKSLNIIFSRIEYVRKLKGLESNFRFSVPRNVWTFYVTKVNTIGKLIYYITKMKMTIILNNDVCYSIFKDV